jgi:outer membrane immunogenic protein
MKKLIISFSFVLITGLAFSQSSLYTGTAQLNFGVGLSDSGIPLYIGFDESIARNITIGGELSYRDYNESWQNTNYDHNIIGISVNANYHFNNLLGFTPRWDLYVGPNVGFYIWTSPDGYTGNHSSSLGWGGQIGARYYLTNSLGINIEFGGGNAFTGGKLGLSIRL